MLKIHTRTIKTYKTFGQRPDKLSLKLHTFAHHPFSPSILTSSLAVVPKTTWWYFCKKEDKVQSSSNTTKERSSTLNYTPQLHTQKGTASSSLVKVPQLHLEKLFPVIGILKKVHCRVCLGPVERSIH